MVDRRSPDSNNNRSNNQGRRENTSLRTNNPNLAETRGISSSNRRGRPVADFTIHLPSVQYARHNQERYHSSIEFAPITTPQTFGQEEVRRGINREEGTFQPPNISMTDTHENIEQSQQTHTELMDTSSDNILNIIEQQLSTRSEMSEKMEIDTELRDSISKPLYDGVENLPDFFEFREPATDLLVRHHKEADHFFARAQMDLKQKIINNAEFATLIKRLEQRTVTTEEQIRVLQGLKVYINSAEVISYSYYNKILQSYKEYKENFDKKSEKCQIASKEFEVLKEKRMPYKDYARRYREIYNKDYDEAKEEAFSDLGKGTRRYGLAHENALRIVENAENSFFPRMLERRNFPNASDTQFATLQNNRQAQYTAMQAELNAGFSNNAVRQGQIDRIKNAQVALREVESKIEPYQKKHNELTTFEVKIQQEWRNNIDDARDAILKIKEHLHESVKNHTLERIKFAKELCNESEKLIRSTDEAYRKLKSLTDADEMETNLANQGN